MSRANPVTSPIQIRQTRTSFSSLRFVSFIFAPFGRMCGQLPNNDYMVLDKNLNTANLQYTIPQYDLGILNV